MSRSIAIIGIVAVIAAIYVLLLQPMAEKRVDMQSQLQANYGTLLKLWQYQALKDQSAKRLENAQKALENVEQQVLPHSDTSVAGAKLQMDIQRIATQSGLTVTSVKPLPTVESKNYTGLPIFMDCTGDIKDLGDFLKALDSRNTMLSIDKLNVATQQDGKLRIKIQITGLMLSS